MVIPFLLMGVQTAPVSPVVTGASTLSYSDIINSVNMTAVEDHVRYFASLETRATGYSGNDIAAQYVYNKFQQYGLVNVSYHTFRVADCVDQGANITFTDGTHMRIYPMLPNFAVPSTTGPEGVTGHLVYLKDGYPEDLQGEAIDNSIAIMNWESAFRWLKALDLGAKAFIFITPPGSSLLGGPPSIAYYSEMEASTKCLYELPLKIPRFYVPQNHILTILNHLGEKATIRAHTYWQNMTGRNVLGFLEGTKHKDLLMLTAHYDSYSDSPSYSPGAQEATGVAALLELAKFFKAHPPTHSIIFIAYGGHGQGMEGSLQFVDDYINPLVTNTTRQAIGWKILGQVNLDLDTTSDFVRFTRHGCNQQYRGSEPMKVADMYSPFGTYLNTILEEITQLTGKRYRCFITNRLDQYAEDRMGQEAQEFFFGSWYRRKFDTDWLVLFTEQIVQRCHPGYTFTGGVFNKYLGHPFDTIERVDFNNLQPQLELIYCLLDRTLNVEPSLKKAWEFEPFGNKAGLTPGKEVDTWRSLEGRVGEWSKEKAWYTPVPGAIIIIKQHNLPMYGIPSGHPLYRRFTMADQNGYFKFEGGLGPATNPSYPISAWVINASTGDVVYTPDMGIHMFGPPVVVPAMTPDLGYIAVFKCSQIATFDVLTPDTLTPPQEPTTGAWFPPVISVYGEEYAPLESWSFWYWTTPTYSLVIVAFPPGVPAYISVKKIGERYPYMFLNNATEANPIGAGYTLRPGQQLLIHHSMLKYAQEMCITSGERFNSLLRSDPAEAESVSYKNLKEVKMAMNAAQKALDTGNYNAYFLQAYRAFSLGTEAYLYSRIKIEDSSLSVPLLSAFLVPFVLLGEKLFFDTRGKRKVFGFILIFVLIVGGLYILHPGFGRAASPIMNIIGFTSLILIAPIVSIMFSHFTSFLKTIRRRAYGVHEVEISRSSAMISAYIMGVENMRKRKLRSSLVLTAVVLMVLSLSGLTSIGALVLPTSMPVSGPPTPPYQGIYIRKYDWGTGGFQLGENLVQYLNVKYGGKATIAPRAWMYILSSYRGRTDFERLPNNMTLGFRIFHGNDSVSVNTITGLTAQEAQVTGIEMMLAETTPPGRWFLPNETSAIILTESVAKKLGVKVYNQIRFAGLDFRLVGIVKDSIWIFLDLDEELEGAISPISFNSGLEPNPWNVHMFAKDFMILPYRFVMDLGGDVANIAMKFQNTAFIEGVAAELGILFPGYLIYSSVGGEVRLHGRGMQVSVMGMNYQITPIAIVCLAILNMSLGAIHERRREIGTLSSVGLSPLHTAFMFLAEMTVYAVVGSIMGYVLALAVMHEARVFLPFLMPNYGTSGVLLSAVFPMVAVLVSVVYPLLVVARQVTPSLERVWKIPTKPVGDLWDVPLPFYTTDEREADQIIDFLREYVGPHMMEGAEIFTVADVRSEEVEEKDTLMKCLLMRVRLRPYERGVRQDATLMFRKLRAENRWNFATVMKRTGGSMDDWQSLNRYFLDALRKQLLLWRSMKAEDRAKYKKES